MKPVVHWNRWGQFWEVHLTRESNFVKWLTYGFEVMMSEVRRIDGKRSYRRIVGFYLSKKSVTMLRRVLYAIDHAKPVKLTAKERKKCEALTRKILGGKI